MAHTIPTDAYAEHWISKKGFDPTDLRKFCNGQTVWHIAACFGRVDILEWLVSVGGVEVESGW